jgi:DNA-binding response OmpR family regulator
MDLNAENNLPAESSNITGVETEPAVTAQDTDINEMSAGSKKATKMILVVDDTPDIVNLVKMYLEHQNYEVITAFDGQEGLDKAKANNPDLIILDLMLPKINGYKVCGLLKRDAKYANIPIVLFTAKTQEKDRKLGVDVGANAYLTKPFEPEVLLAMIQKLLKG